MCGLLSIRRRNGSAGCVSINLVWYSIQPHGAGVTANINWRESAACVCENEAACGWQRMYFSRSNWRQPMAATL